jgi:hypothetical protein
LAFWHVFIEFMVDEESIESVNVYTRIPKDLDEDLKVACARARLSKPVAIAQAIGDWVKSRPHGKRLIVGDLASGTSAFLRQGLVTAAPPGRENLIFETALKLATASLETAFSEAAKNTGQPLLEDVAAMLADPENDFTRTVVNTVKAWKREMGKRDSVLPLQPQPHKPDTEESHEAKKAARPRAVHERR